MSEQHRNDQIKNYTTTITTTTTNNNNNNNNNNGYCIVETEMYVCGTIAFDTQLCTLIA
jgi:transcription initiation factor IIE alpha subunit